MIRHPKIGQQVQAWYAAANRWKARYHGKVGTLRIASAGKNHGVEIDGELVVIPAGNLREPKPDDRQGQLFS